MANHKRKSHRLHKTSRGRSSDWVYPKVENGDQRRGRPSARRWLEKAEATR